MGLLGSPGLGEPSTQGDIMDRILSVQSDNSKSHERLIVEKQNGTVVYKNKKEIKAFWDGHAFGQIKQCGTIINSIEKMEKEL